MTETKVAEARDYLSAEEFSDTPLPFVSARQSFADRKGVIDRVNACELVVEYSIEIEAPADRVWAIFSDFNAWQKRFGFHWNPPPALSTDGLAHLINRAPSDKLDWGDGDYQVTYFVRKVIPGQLIYFESPALPLPGKDGSWTGHNVMCLTDKGETSTLTVFMEHTFHSERMSVDELRAETKQLVDSGLQFWTEYFIPDLLNAVSQPR